LAACKKAVDKEDDYCTDHSTKEACRFSGLIPPNRLAKVSRNKRADNSQNGRQNKAPRLSFVTRHNELGNHPNDKADYNCPKDAHLIAPVLNQGLGIDELTWAAHIRAVLIQINGTNRTGSYLRFRRSNTFKEGQGLTLTEA
jgi:hypothetical protein